jgi:hypothetical protein
MFDPHIVADAPARRMLAPITLALAFVFGAPAVASNSFYAVVPVSGVNAQEQLRPVKIALASATPPAAHVGESYEFNLGALLSLDGPEGTEPGKVTWSVVSGSLPAGLALVGDRVVGEPTELSPSRQVVIRVEHPDAQGMVGAMASYSFEVAGIPIASFGGYRAWEDGTFAQSCEMYIRSGDLLKPYVGATGSGVYRIAPGGAAIDVYCDQTTDGGGWTLVLKSDFQGMRPEIMGKGTTKVCSQLLDGCLTSGTSSFYRGTPVAAAIRDYMFLQSPGGAAGLMISPIIMHAAQNYIRGPVAAPGTPLYELMTDAMQGWAHPGNQDADPSDQLKYLFESTNGYVWSDGNWHGCGLSGYLGGSYCGPTYPYQAGAQVKGNSNGWGHHHFIDAPKYDASTGLYTLAAYTYYNVGTGQPLGQTPWGVTRTINKAELEAWRWAVLVR